MTKELTDFGNLLVLRNQMISLPSEKLLELYQDADSFIVFIDTIAMITDVDNAFLLFSDSVLEKILSIVQIHRFDFESAEIKGLINDIISYVNVLRTMSPKVVDCLKKGYLSFHEEQRGVHFPSEVAFLNSLSYDGVVFHALSSGKVDLIQDDKRFLMSLNYLMKACPDLFQDAEVKSRVNTLLERIRSHSKLFSSQKRMLKRVSNNFKEVFQKEE